MERFTEIVFGFYGLILGSALLILIYLIVKRIKIKKKENFEDRNN
tara:strand:+ start:11618 stop:11752 length:135 start_codon:yes stop_codon:yes gene_type:complete